MAEVTITPDTVERIARLLHEVLMDDGAVPGEDVHQEWATTPEWMRDLSISEVEYHLADERNAVESHAHWYGTMAGLGWVDGPTYDEVAKEHPNLIEFADLPPRQQLRYKLMGSFVRACYRMIADDYEQG